MWQLPTCCYSSFPLREESREGQGVLVGREPPLNALWIIGGVPAKAFPQCSKNTGRFDRDVGRTGPQVARWLTGLMHVRGELGGGHICGGLAVPMEACCRVTDMYWEQGEPPPSNICCSYCHWSGMNACLQNICASVLDK